MVPTLLSMDPGLHLLPWAEWDLASSLLVSVGFSEVDVPRLDVCCNQHAQNVARGLVGMPKHVYVERMNLTVQQDGHAPIAKGNDCLALQAIGAYVAGHVGGVLWYRTPGEWKGQAKKKITQNRVDVTLDALELEILHKGLKGLGKRGHNLYDAVGIGLCATGRYRVR